MRIKTIVKILLLLILLGVVSTVVAFYHVYRHGIGDAIRLPGNYEIASAYFGDVGISRASDHVQVIGSPVDGYAIDGHIVVGHVGKPASGDRSEYGYFMIDTRNDVVRKRLGKEEYCALLHKYGVLRMPVLKRPFRWFAL